MALPAPASGGAAVATGAVTAFAASNWCVSVRVDGLDPDRWYSFTFDGPSGLSPEGRLRTAPAPGSSPTHLRFAFGSCQQRSSPYVAMAAIEACRRQRLFFGVASSLCKNNLDDLLCDAFLEDMIRRGALYAWYYIYRPSGPDPAPDLALDAADILRVRRFLVEARRRHPILIVDAYWDADGRALTQVVLSDWHIDARTHRAQVLRLTADGGWTRLSPEAATG